MTPLRTSRIHRVRHGDARMEVDSADEVSLVLLLTEAHRVTYTGGGRRTVVEPEAGAFTVFPPGSPVSFQLHGTATVLTLRLSWAELSAWGAEDLGLDPSRMELQRRLACHDAALARWFYGVAGGVEDEEEALRAIDGRLLQAHAVREAPAPSMRFGGLPPVRLRRVRERIEAHLDRSLALVDLAAEAGMSVFHFAREFRRATGMPPHRYVLRRRLAHAVTLLAEPRLTVAEVAARTGFAHATHLARHLRRTTGMAPEAFRAGVLLR